jgi:hypothetical protein
MRVEVMCILGEASTQLLMLTEFGSGQLDTGGWWCCSSGHMANILQKEQI